MLHGGGGGQQEIGVTGGVRQHLLVHDGEEVLAREPAQHRGLIRAHRDRIGVVHVEGADGRGQPLIRQHATQMDHVDGPGHRPGREIAALQDAVVETKLAERGEQGPAVRVNVGAGQRGQAGDRPAGHAAVLVP